MATEASNILSLVSLSPFLSGMAGMVVGVLALTYAMSKNSERVNRSTYDAENSKAVLSMMRDSYESQISSLNKRLTATESRWIEANHLILDAQRAQMSSSNIGAHSNLAPDRFLAEFGIDANSEIVDPKLVFVLTPFEESEMGTYKAIRSGCSELGYRCVRGDEEFIGGPILPHILRQILQARLVIANISTRNANVFYELGIAQALGKSTLLVSHYNQEVPFDIQNSRILMYVSVEELPDLVARGLMQFVATETGKR